MERFTINRQYIVLTF